MRILESNCACFRGTHKGAMIEIERGKAEGIDGTSHFYILVTAKDGGRLYDGFCPPGITTMAAAKREAIRGACL